MNMNMNMNDDNMKNIFENIQKTFMTVMNNGDMSNLNEQNPENVIDNLCDKIPDIFGGMGIDKEGSKNIASLMKGAMKHLPNLGQEQHNMNTNTRNSRNNSNVNVHGNDQYNSISEEAIMRQIEETQRLKNQVEENQILKNPGTEKDYKELNNDEKDIYEIINPRTKDKKINLNVTLEELYTGSEKKIVIKRNRLKKNPKTKQYDLTEEERKILVPITPGMYDSQKIRYSKQADEYYGHDTGDIVVILKQNGHDTYERIENNLFVRKVISLYESYAFAKGMIKLHIKTLNGYYIELLPDGSPLHLYNGYRKIIGQGMPILESDNEYGDLFIQFYTKIPESLSEEHIHKLKTLFPPEKVEHIPEKYIKNKHILQYLDEDDGEILNLNETYSKCSSDISDDDSSRSDSSNDNSMLDDDADDEDDNDDDDDRDDTSL